ncbi:MAG TPA: condensin subunit MukF [Polyangiaceae bacterium]|nr:condensin subunit MukF [Polyangiaceae bacterium]
MEPFDPPPADPSQPPATEAAAPTPTAAPSNEATALLALSARAPKLELSTLDLCFLATLYLRGQGAGHSAFSEEQLFELFEQAAQIVERDPSAVRKRATHAIARLRAQRLLARVDGAGVMRAGEYALSRLGASIVSFFLEDEVLTTETLTLLARTLESSLRDVLARARTTTDAATLDEAVVGPLKVTVHELMEGIERRQRGLDLQQEQFQKEISALLSADWFGAVESCQTLLESTAGTLRDLNHVLLSESHRLQAQLEDLQELALRHGAEASEEAIRRAADQIDRIAAWSSGRQKSWSDYYQYVHRFLRDVVRLDPSRALTARLRDQISGKGGKRFTLAVATTPAPLLLREVAPAPDRPPVKRPRAERDTAPDETVPVDPYAVIEDSVRQKLDAGAASLRDVTAQVTAELPEDERFRAAGRVAQVVARLARTHSDRERPWLPVDEAFAIEEWTLPRKDSAKAGRG